MALHNHRPARIVSLFVTACVIAALLVPVAVVAVPDSGGSIGTDQAAVTGRTHPVIPASWEEAGYKLACECTTRRSAGRHILSDNPYGCRCGEDVMVVKDGCCYEVPLPQ